MTSAKGLAVAALFIAVACRGFGGTASSSPTVSPTGTPLHGPSGKLDAEVAMPAGFPADIPIYTGARLTAGASFSSNGQATWGMEWESVDGVDKVRAFYAKQLNQGDWSVTIKDLPSGFSANFARKSNTRAYGTLAADGSSGVTKISMAFVSNT